MVGPRWGGAGHGGGVGARVGKGCRYRRPEGGACAQREEENNNPCRQGSRKQRRLVREPLVRETLAVGHVKSSSGYLRIKRSDGRSVGPMSSSTALDFALGPNLCSPPGCSCESTVPSPRRSDTRRNPARGGAGEAVAAARGREARPSGRRKVEGVSRAPERHARVRDPGHGTG